MKLSYQIYMNFKVEETNEIYGLKQNLKKTTVVHFSNIRGHQFLQIQ